MFTLSFTVVTLIAIGSIGVVVGLIVYFAWEL